MHDYHIISWGLGAMGRGMARLFLEKNQGRIVGAIDTDPDKIGRDLAEIIGWPEPLALTVTDAAETVLAQKPGGMILLATSSFTREVLPQIELALKYGWDVITIAEEMSAPQVQTPELAEAIDRLAREQGRVVLGTGINPGFVLDTLVVALTAPCLSIQKIRAERVNDLSPFGPTVMATQGVGTTVDEFERGLADGTIVGHVGFPQSLHLIATALGWELDRIEEEREPIVARERRQSPYVVVEPGRVAGCRHIARGYSQGRLVLELIHPQQVQPQAEGISTGDYITIEGTPTISMQIQPEIPGGLGTIAMAVNAIPLLAKLKPGLRTMLDLPVPRAWLQRRKK